MCASIPGGMGTKDGSGTSQSGAEWSHFNNHNESDEIKIKYKETRQCKSTKRERETSLNISK